MRPRFKTHTGFAAYHVSAAAFGAAIAYAFSKWIGAV